MPTMASDSPSPEKTEAARKNQGGLECSSYTWQVRQDVYAFGRPDCQEKSAGTRPRKAYDKSIKYNITGWLIDFLGQPDESLTQRQ